MRAACEDVRAAGENLTVVVTHVSPIKAAVAWALGVGYEITWRMFVAPASVTFFMQTSTPCSIASLVERAPSARPM